MVLFTGHSRQPTQKAPPRANANASACRVVSYDAIESSQSALHAKKNKRSFRYKGDGGRCNSERWNLRAKKHRQKQAVDVVDDGEDAYFGVAGWDLGEGTRRVGGWLWYLGPSVLSFGWWWLGWARLGLAAAAQ
jgi:hypothetical protein